MTRKFTELEAKMSPESRLRVEKKVRETLAELPRSDAWIETDKLDKPETEHLYAGIT
jgi:hypothetical protein